MMKMVGTLLEDLEEAIEPEEVEIMMETTDHPEWANVDGVATNIVDAEATKCAVEAAMSLEEVTEITEEEVISEIEEGLDSMAIDQKEEAILEIDHIEVVAMTVDLIVVDTIDLKEEDMIIDLPEILMLTDTIDLIMNMEKEDLSVGIEDLTEVIEALLDQIVVLTEVIEAVENEEAENTSEVETMMRETATRLVLLWSTKDLEEETLTAK